MGRLLADAHDRWRGVQHYPADPQSLPAGDRPLTLQKTSSVAGSGWLPTFSGNNQTTVLDPEPPLQLEASKPSFSHDGQKTLDFLLPHVLRVPQTVPFHEHAHPLHVDLLSAQAIVLVTNSLTDLIQQPCGAQHRRGGGFNGQI